MKEYAIQALNEAREREKWTVEEEWIEEGFSELKSFAEVGIEPKTSIYDLSYSENNILDNFIDRQKGLKNPEYIYDELSYALALFYNVIGEIWIDPDDEDSPLPMIEDFLDIKAEDLEGFGNLTLLQRKMIEQLFASSTSSSLH